MAGLQGQWVVDTRPAHQQARSYELLQRHGATHYSFPCLEIQYLSDANAQQWLPRGGELVTFTSANGVEGLRRAVEKRWEDVCRALQNCSIGVVGGQTAAALRRHGLKASIMPEVFDAKSLAQEILKGLESTTWTGTCWLVQASDAKPDLFAALQSAGLNVQTLEVYKSVCPVLAPEVVNNLIELYQSGRIAATVFTSERAIEHFMQLCGQPAPCGDGAEQQSILAIPVAVIGPNTARAAERAGFSKIVQSAQADIEILISALDKYFRSDAEDA